MSGLLIRQYEIGLMENFVYFVGDEKTREILIVDPAWEVDTILKHAAKEDLKVAGALVTHHHYDHTNGIEDLLQKHDVPVYIHKKDAPRLEFKNSNIKLTEGGETIKVGSIDVQVLHTPGHTHGSQCFVVKDNVISGDTLFINACGRTDFDDGNIEEMYKSLYNRLGALPSHTTLYPGHNYADKPTSTMGDERERNPYLMCDSLQNFLRLRGSF
jgi:glyoxylase-like metal-dependent hydrolase (beta-lactamase superfamily II)